VIHGGAGHRVFNLETRAEIDRSLNGILQKVYPRLKGGSSALQAVISAVSQLEDDPLYNAGKGSKIQSDGHIRMSAAVMDGAHRRFAGCMNIEGVKNPIRLAELLLRREDRVLAGRGAQLFAREHGLAMASPFTAAQRLNFKRRRAGKSGTVGAVAIDRRGRLAAATSTGGRGFEYPGRISDSATCAGNFASPICAVSATGVGEQIVEFAAASTVTAYVEAGLSLSDAVRKLFISARRYKAEFGLIALDRRGHVIAKTSTTSLIWASISSDGIRTF
jgi:L-asparaginase